MTSGASPRTPRSMTRKNGSAQATERFVSSRKNGIVLIVVILKVAKAGPANEAASGNPHETGPAVSRIVDSTQTRSGSTEDHSEQAFVCHGDAGVLDDAM